MPGDEYTLVLMFDKKTNYLARIAFSMIFLQKIPAIRTET